MIFLLLPYFTILPALYVFHNIWLAMISYHLAILVIAIFSKKIFLFANLTKGWTFRGSYLGILICAGHGIIVYYIWHIISLPGISLSEKLVEYGLPESSWILFIIYYSLVTPWLEEFFWRDFLVSRLRFPFLSDLAYAGYHFFVISIFIKPFFAILTVFALLVVAKRWRNISSAQDGLLVPVITHMITDFSTAIAVILLAIK